MKILTVAGEFSGDAHGGEILVHLKKILPDLEITGIGGDTMVAAGMKMLLHISQLQARGLLEVVRHLPKHFRLLKDLDRLLDRERPDALLLIDYPGFNLRLARVAKRKGIPVLYYSSPQLWAWRGGRMRMVQRWVDRIIVLFPFEETLYTSVGVDAVFLGHPLVGVEADAKSVQALRKKLGNAKKEPIIAVMPGSRPSELERNFPSMLQSIALIRESGFKGRFVVPLAPTLTVDRAKRHMEKTGIEIEILEDAFLPLLKVADFGLVASGTATLQVGMAGIPFIVVYRVSQFTYRVAKWFAYIKHISIVNILAGREIVPELLQHKFTPERLCEIFLRIVNNEKRLQEMKKDLKAVKDSLGKPGAYKRAADEIAKFLKNLGAKK